MRLPRFRLPSLKGPWLIITVSLLAVLVVAAGLTVRYGVNTGPGRAFLESRLEGLKLGRFGRLHVEGLSGDLWRDLKIRRLTISDEKGVWLEGRNAELVWRSPRLVSRRLFVDRLTAQRVIIYRRPILSAPTPPRPIPLSVQIETAHLTLETLPAFSYQAGLFDIAGNLDVERNGGTKTRIQTRSLLHLGDYANIAFDLGGKKLMALTADASEAKGGALAGALGLPADQTFKLTARLSGTVKEGRFNLVTTSGTTTPAQATGAWNAAGGNAQGDISLAASRLTTPLARMFGDRARFTVTGAKAKTKGLYALEARADAENLSATVKGEANVGQQTTGPAGLALTARTPNLGRIAGPVFKGGAQAQGVFKGVAKDWKIVGSLAGDKLDFGPYDLARASGTVTVGRKDRETTISGKLTGQGGSGSGYLAALLGGAPTAVVELVRLKDGRLLMKRLDANGVGLKVQGSGDRGILGGLNFKGQAQLTNLKAARAGANGGISGGWSASQAAAGKPWLFTVDARGSAYASGWAELDRLLGPTPHLKLAASYADGAVSLGDGRLEGKAGQMQAKGVLGKGGTLGFNLNWTAEGPFHAGPVEIAGKAKGDGALTGTLGAPRADLNADFDAIDLPRLPLKAAHVTLSFLRGPNGTDGQFAITATSAFGAARAKTAFNFMPGGLDLTGLDADAGGVQAKGALSLRRGLPSTADLTVAAGPGVLLTQGSASGMLKIVDAAGGPRVDLDITAKNATLRDVAGVRFDTAHLRANGPLSQLPVAIQAQGVTGPGPFKFDSTGTVTNKGDRYQVALDGAGQFVQLNFKTLETGQFAFGGGGDTTAHLRLAMGKGKAALDARSGSGSADILLALEGVELGVVNEDLAGQIDAKLTLRGQGTRLGGALEATLNDARARGSSKNASMDGTVKATLNDTVLDITAQASNDKGLQAQAALTLPVEASAAPLHLAIARRQPMKGWFKANGEVKPLWDLLVGGERSLSGNVTSQATLSGTLADPRIVGDARLDGGAFEDGQTGLKLKDVALQADFNDSAIDVSRVQGSDGRGGSMTGSGRISLVREGTSSFRMDLKQFTLINNETAMAIASGQATLNRDAAGKVRLEGALKVDRADIAADPPTPSGVTPMDVIEINKPPSKGLTLQPAKARGLVVALDVSLKASRGIFIEGRGLNAEMSLDARVGGTTADPTLEGVARLVRGEYDFAGKRFQFDNRGAVYLASRADRIRLDLTATRDDPTLTAVIRVRGTAAKPEITLTSTPALPDDEVLSRVLFGSSASQLSPLEAAQLASGLAALAGGGGFDVIGGLRSLTGLDRIAFAGGGASGAMTIAGGKYITDDVYLEIIGGGREGPAAQVEWRVKKTLSIVSRVAGQGDAKLSVRWRKDY
ncbi:translocation and assembly module TamB [Caulobacter ginsengisoli]|uniref:Translocation and assembly module TamB n=1 Tax=Caulobacter ginsengisoli TaxID=400775 RepID=A0ABU0IPM4_9CAUL|nr:translocation/assembly module TamB domain-containing protein [Caulobacter ginsengisoli]MDQ0463960.1 translocation and assembly module TamB [Caulobacter ginsengisoli]